LFSINSLAAAMHVRKAEIVFWIDQGWLETTKEGQGRTVAYLISPDALQRCLRENLQDLQKRNIRSATILAVFNQFCYVKLRMGLHSTKILFGVMVRSSFVARGSMGNAAGPSPNFFRFDRQPRHED
jgi:hypothetical protein